MHGVGAGRALKGNRKWRSSHEKRNAATLQIAMYLSTPEYEKKQIARNRFVPQRLRQRHSRGTMKKSGTPRLLGILGWVSLLASTLRFASAWKDCLISDDDKWVRDFHTLAFMMRSSYERRYTCASREGSFKATTYSFKSPCLARSFSPLEIRECLKGRRIIFLGDSLSTQQADSLIGMMGWYPEFLRKDNPLSEKFKLDEEGKATSTYALLDCWRQSTNWLGNCERCYDVYESTVPQGVFSNPSDTSSSSAHHPKAIFKPFRKRTRSIDKILRAFEWEEVNWVDGKDVKPEDEISVHLRMFPTASGENWLARAMADYNETHSSDVYVINFGAHYHETEASKHQFKEEMGNLLLEMGTYSESATMVWREIAPTHFPAPNGSYDSLPPKVKEKCCTGTPPRLLDWNVWVDTFLEQNGLQDKVKMLRIYDMSRPRGAAHRTCHIESTKGDQHLGTLLSCPSPGPMDCRHWSETGVVEEWNRLLLNHLCPV